MSTIPVVHVTTVPGDPRRDDMVRKLQEDWPSSVCVHADPDRRGILWNHRQVLDCLLAETGPDQPRWALTCQDDVEWLPGWQNQLRMVMQTAPTPFVSLNHFSTHGQRQARRGMPYAVGINAMWGQAVLYSRAVLPSYRQLVEDVWEMDAAKYHKWDDGLAAVHNLIHGTRSSFTSRALVEHQNWDSTVGNVPGRWRHAASTIRQNGPAWHLPSSGGTPSPDALQQELASRLTEWRSNR